MGFFRVSRELQFEVCILGEVPESSCIAREVELLYEGKRMLGGTVVNKEAMASYWLGPRQEGRGSFFLL